MTPLMNCCRGRYTRRRAGSAALRWAYVAALAIATLWPTQLAAALQAGRFLAKEDIVLLGIGLQAAPADQTVPINIATIVSTFLQAPGTLPAGVPPFAPDAVVQATLRGPSYPSGLDLTTRPNTPFNIPPLGVPGLHTLENIRLVSNGSVLLAGSPQSVTINVIEKLLVTQVTARPLTADEIRQRGIVFDTSSFQAYNFTAAFAIQNQTININFPVLLPTLSGPGVPTTVDVPAIPTLTLPTLQTIIPDTLRVQAQVPNLSVVGFTLSLPSLQGQNLIVPPIPGVIVIPGNIGFLNQFFSVTLMVGNVAPAGSNLVVTDLQAHLALPPGNDKVLGTADDPLRMARTAAGDSPSTQSVVQPGADGKLGTADDIASLGPGQTAQTEFLVEGLREGTHTIAIDMNGKLNGLPVGPVPISGQAFGAVLVRNPNFTLTFTHPDTVNRGEPYTLDVTVTNTSTSPANIVSVNLLPQNVSGATVVGDASRQIDSIAPSDSATVHFDLVSKVSGKVTAATLDSDQNVAGRFELKTAVGELGVPVSPDSLVLPSQASTLPESLRDAAIGLLGKAWAVATAPAAALPPDVGRFSQKIVLDRGVQVAEAGFRVSLHEPLPDSALQLEMDMIGSDAARLATVYPNGSDLALAQTDVPAFDSLRRASIRGDAFASAVATVLAPSVASAGVAAFHEHVAEAIAYRPAHVSVAIGSASGPLPFSLAIVDAQGRQVGGADSGGKIVKTIPYADLLSFTDVAGTTTGAMAIVAAPTPGPLTVRLTPVPRVRSTTPFTISIVVPDSAGHLRHILFDGVTAASAPSALFDEGAPYPIAIAFAGGGSSPGTPQSPTSDAAVLAPPSSVVGVVQQQQADVLSCPGITPLYPGRVVAALFNQEVTPASVQDGAAGQNITNFAVDGNAVVGVALQPGHRIVFLALRDPIGPFVPRELTVTNVADSGGRSVASTAPIETTVSGDGIVVSGRLVKADGTPVAFANARLFYVYGCDGGPVVAGISSKTADSDGRYTWDYVLNQPGVTDQIVAADTDSGEFRQVSFTPARSGQRLNVDVVLLGRGTLQGRTVAQDGVTPLKATVVQVTSLSDQSVLGATTDELGRFTIAKIPVGNILIEAVNVAAQAKITLSGNIPFANAVVARDLTLLTAAQVTIQNGTLTGRVLSADGVTPRPGLPVVAYYRANSQTGVQCPAPVTGPPPPECAVATATTEANGAFTLAGIIAGAIRLDTFDRKTLEQGGAQVVVPANGSFDVTVLLGAGLGTIHGTVVDPTGHPVAGARVGGGLTLTTTDASGAFTLTDVPVGHRTIVAVSDQLGATGQADADLVRNGDTINVTIVLGSAATIAGTVVQSDGTTPVPNVKVYAIQMGDVPRVADLATTDRAGHYTIAKLPLGDYTVSAFKADFTDGNVIKVLLQANSQTLRGDIAFRGAGGRVTGAVFDADGTTPLKARVGITGDRVAIANGVVATGFERVTNFAIADTDLATGQFTIDGLFTGDFVLSAVGQFSPDPISLNGTIPSPGATVQMNLRLQATSHVTGTVFQPDGVTPAAGVAVSYHSDAFKVICDGDACTTIPQGIQQADVVTGGSGRYDLPLVNAGSFTLTATDQQTGRVAQVHGSVRAGQEVDVPVRLLGTGELTVKVLGNDAVTPIPGAEVHVTQTDYPGRDITLFADSNGSVSFIGGDALTEGTFVVTARDVRNGLAGRASGSIASDGQQLTVSVFLFNASGSVSGTVFAPDGTTPITSAEVVISNASGPLAFAITDSTGHYSQDLIPLGPFTVEVFEAATARRGSASGRIDLDRQAVTLNVIEMAQGLVRGSVAASGSLQPVVGALVRLSQKQPSGRSQPLVTTSGTDGTFSFPGVALGSFTLAASIAKNGVFGSATAGGAIDHEGAVVDIPVVLDLTQPLFGRITGTTLNPDGTVAANTQVTIACPNCAFGGTTVTAGADGRFALDHAQIGRFTISAVSQTTHNVGSASGQLSFDGEIADVPVVLAGVGRVSGTVSFAAGGPAAGAQILLSTFPTPACSGPGSTCALAADAGGGFSFDAVPAGRFTIAATDPLSGLKGTVSGTIAAGATASANVVLQPSAAVHGRVLLPSGAVAVGIAADLTLPTLARTLFAQTGPDGTFAFGGVPLVPFSLTLHDPLGAGLATRTGAVTGDVDLGDVTLDDTAFAVASTLPIASAVGVDAHRLIQIVFDETVQFGTVDASHVTLTGPSGAVDAALAIGAGGTTVTITPLAPLADATRYTVRVSGVADRLGRALAADYVFSFTTADLTPPAISDVSPAPNTTGVALSAVVRVQFSEPIDPAKFSGAPLALAGPSGAVPTRLDYLSGNSVLVLTPLQPLAVATVYHVTSQAATDLSGNSQSTGLDYTFVTATLTPPVVRALTASRATVIEGTAATVTADVGTADVAFVDFLLNDVFSGSARSAPFAFSFVASARLGKPGDQIKVSAVATDTSGLRGQTPASTFITIAADRPPMIAIGSPADGARVHNGDRVTVSVHATDDVGVAQVGYKAGTGRPQDAAARALTPASVDDAETFAFNIPADAVPGSTIAVQASAVDAKGQTTQAQVSLVVLDAIPPTVTITGATTGTTVTPGQQTTIVVSAQDAGGVASIAFAASGAASFSQTRAVSPAQSSAVTSFTFTVSAAARPGDSVTLTASATDQAGNVGTANSVILPIADSIPPRVRLRTQSGRLDVVRGTTVVVIADADDESAVARVDLTGTGAVVVNDSKPVSPPVGSASVSFSIQIPASAQPGQVLNLQAKAVDTAGNVSLPASLSLTVESVASVGLPASAVLVAGQTQDFTLQLSDAAPAGGLTVTLVSGDPNIASVVTPAIAFAEGELSKPFTLAGVAGGTTSVTALVQGVDRGSMALTVRGGIVTGTVLDPNLHPVAGVQITIGSKGASTDGNGNYFVEGVVGQGTSARDVTVKAFDPVSRLLGLATGQLTVPNGSAQINVVLVAAGSIDGVVRRADGQSAGAGVQVTLFTGTDLSQPTATTVTLAADGSFSFPLVSIGSYTIDAIDQAGNHGRASATVSSTGQDVAVVVTYLGRGTVTGTVVNASAQPVANAQVTLTSSDLFGQEPAVTISSGGDGTFTFTGVHVGLFTLTAHDQVTGQSGTASGQIGADGQVVSQNVSIAPSASIAGTVFRSDGVTIVPGATVTAERSGVFVAQAVADDRGRYTFAFLPLGQITLTARDLGSRGIGTAQVNLTTNGVTVTQDIDLLGQGTLAITVVDSNGATVAAASVEIDASSGLVTDTIFAQTGGNGVAVVQNVLAGPFVIKANANGVSGSVSGTLATGQLEAITVALQAVGSIAGTVFAPDGQTPVGTAQVKAVSPTVSMNFVPVNADGTFRIDNLALGVYTLSADDDQFRLRAVANGVTVSSNGQVVNQTLTFVALGRVTGRVINPDGSSASNMVVQLQSLDLTFGKRFRTRTDAAGFYEVDGVAAGMFTVSTGDVAQLLLGEGSGTIANDGQVVNVDILLQGNAVNLPFSSLFDANNDAFDVQRDGSSSGSQFFAFGAPFLDVVSNGAANRFTGATFGTFENQKQSVAVRQQALAGLDVTRKMFVPNDGYFARHLEILSNPTGSPITVDVRITSNFRTLSGNSSIIATSSGGAALSVADPANPDRWLVVDDAIDQDADVRAAAVVFDGPGAARRVTDAQFAINVPNPGNSSQLTHAWTNVVVPPNGTVAFMYFESQEISRAAAIAAGQRLVQLPPEALSGLSLDELQAIQNFVVPADGFGTVAPLPPLTGVVTGRVLDVDGTPLANTTVAFTSGTPLFARKQTATSNSAGAFTFTGVVNGLGTSKAIPIGAFTLQATSLATGVASQSVAGGFASGATTATQDLVFANTAIVAGTVRRTSGALVTNASIVFTGSALPFGSINSSVKSDGTYRLSGIPAGTFTLKVTITNPQGSPLTQTVSVTTTAGQVVQLNVVMPGTGIVKGIVSRQNGTPAPGAKLTLRDQPSTFTRIVTADTSGAYTFPDVPVGAYVIDYTDTRTNIKQTTAPFIVVQDQTTIENLTVPAVGSVRVQVNFARGTGAPSSQVFLTAPSVSKSGSTDATGSILFGSVSAGTLSVQARHPDNSSLIATAQVTIATEGDTQNVTVTLPAAGTVSGTVTFGNGNPAVFGQVSVIDTNSGGALQSAFTDGAGAYTAKGIQVGSSIAVRVFRPGTSISRDVPAAALATDGQIETVNAVVIAFATVRVTVRQFDGTPMAGARVEWRDAAHQFFALAGFTDGTGRVSIANVEEGSVSINVRDPNTFAIVNQTAGTVRSIDEGTIVDVVAQVSSPRGTIQGAVFAADGTTPASNVSIVVRNAQDNTALASTTTGGDGTYQVANVLAGDGGFTVTASAPSGDSATQAGSFTAPGQIVTINFTLPIVRGNVQGHVVAADGATAVPGAGVRVFDASASRLLASGTADHNGAFLVTNVSLPVGPFVVVAQSTTDASFSGRQTASAATQGQTVQVTVTLPVVRGSARGTIFGGDGATPVLSASVRLLVQSADPETGLFTLASVLTGPDGAYAFTTFDTLAGSQGGFLIRAFPPVGSSMQIAHAFASQNEQATIDFTLPLTVVKGRFAYPDGSVPDPAKATVFVTASDQNTYFGQVLDDQDHYLVLGAPVGNATLTAQDGVSGMAATGPATIASVDTATIVSLTFASSGTIAGQVIGVDGNPVGGATVALSSDGVAFQRFALTDGSGGFSFVHVPMGVSTLQATWFDTQNRTATTTVTLTADGQKVTVTLGGPNAAAAAGASAIDVVDAPGDQAGAPLESIELVGPVGGFVAPRTGDSRR